MKKVSGIKLSKLGGIIMAAAICFSVPVMAEEAIEFSDVVVTGTREKEAKAETPATIGTISENEVSETKPAHPTEIMDRIPGVHVNVTNGEGHMTAIRQPITTGAVYLYLEDGIPTRSTGFFNHNALYEVNVPQADGIEVTKGPGTSLYGSDAIGGIINVMTRPAPEKPEAEITVEGGEYGWERALLTTGGTFGSDGVRADVNITHTDGWREATDYDRKSATLRWDRYLDSGATLKTVITTSDIDQQTAGNSKLSETDYEDSPRKNNTPISYRDVEATRISVVYEKELASSLISVTPYYRKNYMELLPNWALSYDPTVYETYNDSFGLLLKYRKDVKPMRTRIVVGADIDYSPGGREEYSIEATRNTDKIYDTYYEDELIYDYDVTYQGVSPYIHLESSPTDKLRVNAGLRYDNIKYDYENNMADGVLAVPVTIHGAPKTLNYDHPEDQDVDFSHLSPKLGLTYAFTDNFNGFVSYRHAFRAPSEGQLFRQGSSVNTLDLDPVKVDSYEIGLRGRTTGKGVSYEISGYHMIKKDDILSYEHDGTILPAGTREVMNGGETKHEGIEVGLGIKVTKRLSLNAAYSYSKHIYEDWVIASATKDYSGKAIEAAPRETANVRLGYQHSLLSGGKVEFEWVHIGDYWMDQANTHKYHGHDLYNLRANLKIGKSLDLFGRVMNLNDERYATLAAYNSFRGKEYAPGMPRTVYAGLTYSFEGSN